MNTECPPWLSTALAKVLTDLANPKPKPEVAAVYVPGPMAEKDWDDELPRDHCNRIGPKRFRVLGIDVFARPFSECVLLDTDDYFDAIRVATKANKFFRTHM